MKYDPKESYESWAKRVQMFEHGYALQRIASGEEVNLVLEDMARRVTDKLIHPVIKHIQAVSVAGYSPEKSKKDYDDNYLKSVEPHPDHVLDDLTDKKNR